MRIRTDYDKALSVIGMVVRTWDPYGLIESGAPADEFDTEIARLATYVLRIANAAEAAKALSEVFTASFEPGPFTPELCAGTGRELFDRLSAAGLARGA